MHLGVSDESHSSLHKPLITWRPLCLCPAGEEEVSNLAAIERLWRPYSRADTPPQKPIYWMCRETLHMSMWTTAWPCNKDKREELQKQIYHFYQPHYRLSSRMAKSVDPPLPSKYPAVWKSYCELFNTVMLWNCDIFGDDYCNPKISYWFRISLLNSLATGWFTMRFWLKCSPEDESNSCLTSKN